MDVRPGARREESFSVGVSYDLSRAIGLVRSFRDDCIGRLRQLEEEEREKRGDGRRNRVLRPSYGRTLWKPDAGRAPGAGPSSSSSSGKTEPGAQKELGSPRGPPVHIFVDNSNVYYGFLGLLRERYGDPSDFLHARLDYPKLIDFLADGRDVVKCCVVASEGIGQAGRVRRVFESMGFKNSGNEGFYTVVLQRVPSLERISEPSRTVLSKTPRNEYLLLRAREQSVDESLHHAISLSLLDFEPATLILVTGDGGSSPHSPEGFPGWVQRALAKGWDVEVASWSSSLSPSFLQRFGKHPQFRVRLLDPHVDEFCFLSERADPLRDG